MYSNLRGPFGRRCVITHNFMSFFTSKNNLMTILIFIIFLWEFVKLFITL